MAFFVSIGSKFLSGKVKFNGVGLRVLIVEIEV